MPLKEKYPLVRRVSDRPVTASMLVLGLVLVALFPFDALATILTNMHTEMPAWLRALAIQGKNTTSVISALGWWDTVAVFWTIIFLVTFMIIEFPLLYRGPNATASAYDAARNAIYLGAGSVIACGVSGGIFLANLEPDSFGWRVCAKILLLLWIVVTDLMIVYLLKVPEAAKRDFKSVLFTIDLPAFSALAVVSAFLLHAHGNSHDREFEGFASGVSAMVLLFINVAFGFQIITEGSEKTARVVAPQATAILAESGSTESIS